MNSTSPSSSLVRIAARSPARSSAGPDVMCSCTPISAATMPASVVLPRPGGPANSRWSAAWLAPAGGLEHDRRGAPSARAGRRTRRGGAGADPTSSTSSASSAIAGSRNSSRTAGPEQLRARRAAASTRRVGGRQLAQRLADLVGAVAEPGERLAHVADRRRRRRRRPAPPTASSTGRTSRLLQLDEQPLGGLLADAGHEGQRGEVAAGDDVDQRRRRVGGEDASASAGPTPWVPISTSNVARSSRWRKPYSVWASSRMWWWTWRNAVVVGLELGQRARRAR